MTDNITFTPFKSEKNRKKMLHTEKQVTFESTLKEITNIKAHFLIILMWYINQIYNISNMYMRMIFYLRCVRSTTVFGQVLKKSSLASIPMPFHYTSDVLC